MTRDSEPAYSPHFKSSDTKKLSADAKILIALAKRQPQKRLELIKSTGIHPSTFSRIRRLLLNESIIRETPHGYCLWDYVDPTRLWNRLRLKLQGVGGSLIDLKIEKLELGDKRDPGYDGTAELWYETTDDVKTMMSSAPVRQVLADAPNFNRKVTMVIVEEHTII